MGTFDLENVVVEIDDDGSFAMSGNVIDIPDQPPIDPPPTDGVIWNPGHYIKVQGNYSAIDQEAFFESVARQIEEHVTGPNAIDEIIGVLVPFAWGRVNPVGSEFYFDDIDRILDMLEPSGKKLMIMPGYKSFTNGGPMYETPSDLIGQVDQHNQGWWGGVHRTAIMSRFNDCIVAMGERYNGHPNFEALTLMESAPSFGGGFAPSDYNVRGYSIELQRMYETSALAWPNTNVAPSINALSNELSNLFERCFDLGIGISGPDLREVPAWNFWMGREANGETPVRNYQDTVARPITVSDSALNISGRTPADIIKLGQSDQGVTHYSWITSIKWEECKAAIQANPTVNVKCPSRYSGCKAS